MLLFIFHFMHIKNLVTILMYYANYFLSLYYLAHNYKLILKHSILILIVSETLFILLYKKHTFFIAYVLLILITFITKNFNNLIIMMSYVLLTILLTIANVDFTWLTVVLITYLPLYNSKDMSDKNYKISLLLCYLIITGAYSLIALKGINSTLFIFSSALIFLFPPYGYPDKLSDIKFSFSSINPLSKI